METIKFAGDYVKLHGQTLAELKDISIIYINENTSKELIDYDTLRVDGSKYNLKNGKYLQLLFMGAKDIPFSTFRKFNKDNEKYWNLIGEDFKIEIVKTD